jgi:CDP-paratose 2-epimerase
MGRNPVLITGGAGFIGTNLADRLLSAGQRILIFDNLSRSGSEANLAWLSAKHGARLQFERGDVRRPDAIRRALRHVTAVFHFAAQVAVTDSLTDPQHDFDVNACGTLHLLEAIRQAWNPPAMLFTSTNKVYGALADLDLFSTGRRYLPKDRSVAKVGINESRGLDFHSPYGCSKGAADQYVLDYARNFKVPAVVFRMSCIFGPHQNGTEDQGWVAHFLMRANDRAPIRIYGDGMQVRDLLFIGDLLDAFELALGNVASTAGHVFNMGGGAQNTVSLLELLDLIRGLTGERCRTDFRPWRSGDQRYYVSDTRKFKSFTGWSPRVGVQEGLEILHGWLLARKECELPLTAAIDERQPALRGAAAAGN